MMKLKSRCQARTRHELSVVAVLQMLNLYKRQLKNAQSLLETDAPWSDAITCSAQQDMVAGTLFLKSRFNPTCIERRILNSKPTVKNVDTTFEETQGFQDYQRSEEQVPRDREKRRGRRERYSTRGLDDSEPEDDFSAYAKPATKQKNVSAMGWLRDTFSSSKNSDKQKPKLKLKVSNSDVSEECAGHSKEEISTEADELFQKGGQSMAKENAPKNREAGILSGVKTGLSKVLTKIGSEKKSKRKESASINIEDSDTEEKAKWGNKAKNKQADIPSIPRKRQKKEEKNFSCPLCNCKFSEEEINEHAFTCNGEPPRTTRNNVEVFDQSVDFIPLETGSSFFKGQQSISAKATQKDDYSEWQKACKKVDMGKVRPVLMDQLVNDKTEISLEASYKEMCKDSEKLCRDIISENEKKTTLATKEKEVKEFDKDSRTWMSSDSDSQQDPNKTTDFLHQYLDAEQIVNKPKKRPMGMNGAKKRPRAAILDQEDSMGNGDNMEKCFICSKIFPTGKVYNKHVNECLSREEGEEPCNNEKTHNFANGAQPSQDQRGLHKRLGNRKSWAPFEKKAIYDEDDIVENPDSDEFNQDSPIKSFKPVGESSLFNFGNQFKNKNPNQKGSKLSTKLPRRRKRRKDN